VESYEVDSVKKYQQKD